ncbi:MAG: 30S ribosomal protein S16 [Planctomycetota bacterium]|nr:30S ribosomal protein S16 [Planctomycetota bacterium]
MAVRIRLARFGRLHRPFFRIVAIDARESRDGKALEVLGTYDPLLPDGQAIQAKRERIEAWLKQGAVMVDTVRNLLKHHGFEITYPVSAKIARRAKDRPPRKDGTKFVPPTRRALRKHAARLKAQRKAAAQQAAGQAAGTPAASEPAPEAKA